MYANIITLDSECKLNLVLGTGEQHTRQHLLTPTYLTQENYSRRTETKQNITERCRSFLQQSLQRNE